jgi:hypothetical protein
VSNFFALNNAIHASGNFLYDWQTLVSGVLALGSAIWAGRLIQQQILQAAELEKDRRRRRFRSIRCTMPLLLRNVCEFSDEMVSSLIDYKDGILKRSAPEGLNFPKIELNIISEIREIIEFSDDDFLVQHLSEIVSEIQIILSRVADLRSFPEMSSMLGMAHTVDEYVLQAARLFALVEGLFDYSRDLQEAGPFQVEWSRVSSSFRRKDIYEDHHPNIFAILKRRSNAWVRVWPKEKVPS